MEMNNNEIEFANNFLDEEEIIVKKDEPEKIEDGKDILDEKKKKKKKKKKSSTIKGYANYGAGWYANNGDADVDGGYGGE